ncbi:MAG: DUF2997 domain-containing protein [Anaerolineae bacterium]|nr:DUF2997 domain-containing protein [Anaerolineae bacterium]
MQQVIITISQDGQTSIEVNGIKGESCRDLTAKLRALGKLEGDDSTPEYYEEAEVTNVTGVGI